MNTPQTTKTLLFILHRAPYGTSSLRDSLDAALAAAAFEQRVQLLFSGDGVLALLPGQQADAIGSKDTGKMLQALGYYDINEIYADAVSLEERGLDPAILAIAVTVADHTTLRQLLGEADTVIAI